MWVRARHNSESGDATAPARTVVLSRGPRTAAPLRARIAVPGAVLGALLLAMAFDPLAVWPLALFAVPMLLVAVAEQGFWRGLGIGLIAGLVFWTVHIQWLSLYLGPVPWLALAAVMAVYFGLGSGLIGWVSAVLLPRSHPLVLTSLPILIASIWTAREFVSSHWPYGGFPWGRLAVSQVNGPLADGASWLGISGLSFVLVVLLSTPVVLFWRRFRAAPVEIDANRHEGSRVWLGLTASILSLALLVAPSWGALAQRNAASVRVAAVQGNANAGLFAEHTHGQWLQNHLDAVAEAGDIGDYDIMVWPENASDVDPLRDHEAYAALSRLVDETGKPLVVGTITKRGDEYFNTSLLWLPGTGPTDFYDKIHPVPFAEYMPDREFFHALAPDLVDMVRYSYSFGTQDSRFDAAGVVFAPNICFEIAYDELLADSVRAGAGVILAQTNNADFGYSSESAQQLAIARMQSIALGRSVVNISTVGHSAIFGPDGRALVTAPWYTSAVLVSEVPVVYALSPGTTVGPLIEYSASALTVLVMLGLAVRGVLPSTRWRASRRRAAALRPPEVHHT